MLRDAKTTSIAERTRIKKEGGMPRIIYMHADAVSESGSVLKKLNGL